MPQRRMSGKKIGQNARDRDSKRFFLRKKAARIRSYIQSIMSMLEILQ